MEMNLAQPEARSTCYSFLHVWTQISGPWCNVPSRQIDRPPTFPQKQNVISAVARTLCEPILRKPIHWAPWLAFRKEEHHQHATPYWGSSSADILNPPHHEP